MTDQYSKETLSEDPLRNNAKNQVDSRLSLSSQKSEKKAGDSSSTTRRESRRLSRVSETITVISDCTRVPDTCLLCGSGIPFTKCLSCDNEAHYRCIEAFFCTTGRRVNLDQWRCPKCVTMSNMNQEKKVDKGKDESISNPVDPISDTPEVATGCPFCKMNMDHKNCKCHDCVGRFKKGTQVHQSQRCPHDQAEKNQMLMYNKCLQYRDFSTKIDYKYLEDEDRLGYEERYGDEEAGEGSILVKICWAIAWFLLLISFAFPIALISSLIFIFIYCFDACCSPCHPVCCFFLEGIKLPGTCCRGMCSGDPMCSSKDDAKYEKS